MFRIDRSQEDLPESRLPVVRFDEVDQFGQPVSVEQHAMRNSGMSAQLLKVRMHSPHMVKVRSMKFVADVEDDALFLNETSRLQEDCVSVNRQISVSALRHHQRKIQLD